MRLLPTAVWLWAMADVWSRVVPRPSGVERVGAAGVVRPRDASAHVVERTMAEFLRAAVGVG
ncbi:MAG: hypothetical protein ACK5UW_06240 [bacterium]